LSKSGDLDGALASFRTALEIAPDDEQTHLFMGWILAAQGRDREAIDSFERALRAQPRQVRAQLHLADALQRLGRPAEALGAYRRVIELDPANGEARLGRAFALIRLGRWVEARAALEDDIVALPDQPVFRHSLARVLATATDDAVRDGHRALQLAEELSRTMKTVELGQTVAMALAEQGRFEEAAGWQRDLIRVAGASGHPDLLDRLRVNLERYEHRKPCRMPWPENDPVFTPPRPDVQNALP